MATTYPQMRGVIGDHIRRAEDTAKCKVCGSSSVEFITVLPFEFPATAAEIGTPVYACADCGCYWRVFTEPIHAATHFEGHSYNDPARENFNRSKRQRFFEWITRLALDPRAYHSTRPRVLDVGCSYGHLLERFEASNCFCVGIEPIARLRNQQNAAGRHRVYANLDELPPCEGDFDVITLIDSLYYFEDPVQCLNQLARRLSPTGVMVIRVTNRTPLLNLYNRFSRRRISNAIFGDQLIAFSHRAMEACISRTGMRIRSLHWFERRDIAGGGVRQFLYYRVLPVIAATTRLRVTPGLTYTCVRAS